MNTLLNIMIIIFIIMGVICAIFAYKPLFEKNILQENLSFSNDKIVDDSEYYDDKKQCNCFCSSLTLQLINNLNTMEGKYE